ncbi:MAG: M91 family zinc metallopeptidase [Polyangiaceae bacterium]
MGDGKVWNTTKLKVRAQGENAGPDYKEPHIKDPDGKGVARFIPDKHSCSMHSGFLLVPVPPAKFLVDSVFLAIRLGDWGFCAENPNVVMEGAATFTICGLPVAREGDAMVHGGGKILSGSPNMLIGGPTFALPPNLTISGDSKYSSAVVRDLYFLSTTKTGAALLDRIAAHGKKVEIDNNTTTGHCTVGDGSAAAASAMAAGQPQDSTIHYDPFKKDTQIHTADGRQPCPPQVVLGHELGHAVHAGEATGFGGSTDEETYNCGFAHPKMDDKNFKKIVKKKEEWVPKSGGKKAVKPCPTENDLRKDLNLPARTRYDDAAETGPEAKDLRPGNCP